MASQPTTTASAAATALGTTPPRLATAAVGSTASVTSLPSAPLASASSLAPPPTTAPSAAAATPAISPPLPVSAAAAVQAASSSPVISPPSAHSSSATSSRLAHQPPPPPEARRGRHGQLRLAAVGEEHRRWWLGGVGVGRGSREVGDLTVATKVESEKSSVSRRGIGDSGMASLETLVPPEKRGPHYKETVKRTKMLGERLEVGFEMRPQERKLANLPRAPVDRPKRDLPELFTPLTNKEESEVNNFLYGSSHSKKVLVMHDPSNIEITAEKLWCLRPRGWLNDEVINLYLELLKERAEREPEKFLKCHFFNTFFYKKLTCGKTGYDYQSVRRWTTLKKLGYGLVKCDKIFVPVHRDIHWCLAIINMKDRTFQYLDSLGGMDHAVLRILARYIMDELKDKSNIGIDTSSWLEEVSDSLPLQQNGWDCGMFMLKFIDFHSRGLGLSFSQEHMEYFRKRTAKEILRLRAD